MEVSIFSHCAFFLEGLLPVVYATLISGVIGMLLSWHSNKMIESNPQRGTSLLVDSVLKQCIIETSPKVAKEIDLCSKYLTSFVN